MTIWKYPLGRLPVCTLYIPAGAQFLSVQMQNGQPTAWALVDPAKPRLEYKIRMYGTGHVLERRGTHIGTVIDGEFVWHYFAEIVG